MSSSYHLGLAERDRSLNEPFEFANVARPLIRHKRLGSGGGQPQRARRAMAVEELPGEFQDVFVSLTQRRHPDVDAAQSVIEVGPEQLPVDKPGQGAIGRRDNSDVHAMDAVAADAFDRQS